MGTCPAAVKPEAGPAVMMRRTVGGAERGDPSYIGESASSLPAVDPRREAVAEPQAPDGATVDRPMSTADLARAAEPSPTNAEAQPAPAGEQPGQLLPEAEVGDLRRRWTEVQTGFVDEPRRAVQDADALVAGAMKRLAEVFADERSQLEGQWDRGDDVSTEDLRVALQRYRTFFDRLLSI
jgi:hypothetical protein